MLSARGILVNLDNYQQSNGKAKAIVKSMKKIIHAAWNGKFFKAVQGVVVVLEYANCRRYLTRILHGFT